MYYRLHEHLGSGQFGTVNRGVWSPAISKNGSGVEVAVKSLEGSLTEEERVKFLQEAGACCSGLSLVNHSITVN